MMMELLKSFCAVGNVNYILYINGVLTVDIAMNDGQEFTITCSQHRAEEKADENT